MKNKFLQLTWLKFVMCLSFLAGTGTFAQTIWNGSSDTTWYLASQDTFYLSTGEDLSGLAQLVNAGITFSGKTIVLTSDIWLNANNYDTLACNNWIPIGGNPTAASETDGTPMTFEGVFNGNNHAIYNMYVNKANYFQAGFFGLIKSSTVKNTAFINPYVKSKGMMGVIVGWFKVGGSCYIMDCMVINATIVGTGGNNIGAIFGAGYNNWYWNYITNCAATGTISGNYPGGLGGNAEYTNFTNCYFAGTLNGTPQGGISAYSGNINNCYSNVSNTSSGNYGTILSSDSMKTDDFVYLLNADAFKSDCSRFSVNNGFPVSSWWLCGVPVTGRTSICVGESTTVKAYGYSSYVWSTGSTTDTITVSPLSTTNYYVTATATSGMTVTDTITITINPQAVITAHAYAPYGEQPHGTVSPSQTTVPCGGSDFVSITITPDTGWHITQIYVNDSLYRGADPSDGNIVTFTFSPNGTLADVVVYFGNTYIITSYATLPDGTSLNRSDLVIPWGENGVTTFLAGNDTTFTFNENERYHLSDVEINGVSQGVISSYTFNNINSDNNTVHAYYYEDCSITIPYIQNFSSYSAYPECWNVICQEPSRTASVSGNTLSIATQSYTYAILPSIDSDYVINDLQIAFSSEIAYSWQSGSLIIGVMTDPAYDSTFVPVDTLPLINSWTDYIVYFSNYTGAGHNIAFKWTSSSYALCYIDNITVDYAPDCSDITGLTVSNVTGNSAVLSWNPTVVGTISDYLVDYSSDGGVTWTLNSCNTNQYILTGINEATSYIVRVITECVEGESQPVTVSFITPCLTSENVQVGSGTANANGNRLLFNNYNGYSYVQQIFTVDEMNNDSREITGIAFQYTASAMTRNMTFYLGHVQQSNFNGNTAFLADSLFTEVYSGNVAFNNSGTDNWFTINFQHNFQYNGIDNLLLVVDDNTGSANYASYSANFYTHSTIDTTALFYSNYSTNADPSNPPAPGSYFLTRNNVRFIYCGITSCPSPNAMISNITDHTADVSWLNDGSTSQYIISYKLSSDSTWTYLDTISTFAYSLAGLQYSTTYDISVTAICSNNMYSNPAIITFTTSCGTITSIPFTENFDSYTNALLPDCWHKIYANDNFPNISNYINQSAPNSLCIYATPTYPCYAILPAIDSSIDIRALELSLSVNMQSGGFVIGIMSDPTDATTFTSLDTIIASSSNTWERYTAYLNRYTGNGHYIAIKYFNTAYYVSYIDDVVVDYLPDCLNPVNLTAQNIAAETADLYWFESGNATQWQIEYGLSGFTQGTGTFITTTSNPYSLTGLTGNTQYDFYVLAVCDSTNSSNWSGVSSFTTDCYPFDIPYVNTFDSTTVGNIPDCWSVLSNSGSYGNVLIGSYNYSAPNSMGITITDTSSLHYVYAVSHLINVGSVDSLIVSFKAMKNNFSDRKLVVGILDSPNDINSLTVMDIITTVNTSWNDFQISLQSYTGTGKYLAIGVPAGENGNASFWIDNLTIEYIGTCQIPLNLTGI